MTLRALEQKITHLLVMPRMGLYRSLFWCKEQLQKLRYTLVLTLNYNKVLMLTKTLPEMSLGPRQISATYLVNPDCSSPVPDGTNEVRSPSQSSMINAGQISPVAESRVGVGFQLGLGHGFGVGAGIWVSFVLLRLV